MVGGGPAGSAAAAALAGEGVSVLLVERQIFPRFRIGESLLPAATPVLERLGALEAVRSAGFVEKHGATFSFEDGSAHGSIRFAQGIGIEEPETWHVDRSQFDELLLQHAVACGAEARLGVQARKPVFGEDGVTLTLTSAGGDDSVEAKFLIDASGQSALVSKHWNLRQPDEELQLQALHTQMVGVAPGDQVAAGDIQVISRTDMGWQWFIPLDETRTSVGVVLPRAIARERVPSGAQEREALLHTLLQESPVSAARTLDARIIAPVRVDADFSYACRRYAGPRWFVVGDAGSFLDPVFSTGVTIALMSGEEAASAVWARLEGERQELVEAWFERTQRLRYKFFRRWVKAFYDPSFRDLLCQPSPFLSLPQALTTVLAGDWDPPFAARWRLVVFALLARVQRVVGLTKRLHTVPPSEPAG